MIIRCPLCGKMANIIVIDSRETGEGFRIRRRRECMLCKQRFTTYEEEKGNGSSGTAAGLQEPQE